MSAARRPFSYHPELKPWPLPLLLSVHAGGRYVIDGNGDPFLLWGEGAWTINTQLANEANNAGSDPSGSAANLIAGQTTYLSTRAAQGINCIGIQVISRYNTNSPNDHDAVAPFTTPDDLATFNSTFFTKLKAVIDLAATYGIVCFVFPAWCGFDSAQGFGEVLVTNGTTKCQNYGAAIAAILEPCDNIIWGMGGDRASPSAGMVDCYDAMIAGIRSVDTRHIVTSHWNFQAGDNVAGDWDDIVSCYDWDGGASYQQVRDEYQENDAPVFLIEALYELNTGFGFSRQIGRFQSIMAMLEGACGAWFGHEGVWHLGAEDTNLPSQSQGHAYDLHSPGIEDQVQIRALFDSIDWHLLVPDASNTLVTSSKGADGTSRIGAAKTADSTCALVYTPDGRAGATFTVDLSVMAGTGAVTCRWYDPTSGQFTNATGSPIAQGSHAFVASSEAGANDAGDDDWILVLET